MTACCRQKDAVVPAAVSTQFLLRSQVPTVIGDNKVDSCEPVNKLFLLTLMINASLGYVVIILHASALSSQ